MRNLSFALGLALVGALAGCGGVDCEDPDVPAFALRFEDPEGPLEDFAAHPWPSDALKRSSGRLRLDHFPNPTDSSTLQDYLRVFAEDTTAYATSAAFYLSFTAPPTAPNDPAGSLAEGAPVTLVDVDPDSPERGRRFGVVTRASAQPGLHLPANHIAGRPVYGAGLRSDTTYAVLLSSSLTSESGAPLEPHPRLRAALSGSCEDSISSRLFAAFEPLRRFVDDGFADEQDIAGATVFTTQPSVAEVRALGAAAAAEPRPEVTGWTFEGGDATSYRLRAELDLPGFQSGERPYRALGDGGKLKTDASGAYVVDHQERTRLGVALPQAGQMPAAGYPVVLYSHGTGGDYASAFSDAITGRLARLGIAVVGYDQTLHGPRDPTDSDPNLTFFNLFNPIAARDNVRQGVADLVVLTNLLDSLRIPAEATAGRGEVRFDPSRIAFVGHSQGALVGAPFAAVDPRIRAHVFSGLGAVLSITLLERKDIVDFEALLTSLLAYPEGSALDDLDPVLNLIQTFIEPADPIAYASSYLPDPPQGRRSDLLQVEGFLDFASPARGQEAFASAAGLPVVSPVHRVPLAAQLSGLTPVDAPAQGNLQSAAGRATGGLIQYPNEDHFPIFEDQSANDRFVEFVRTALLEDRAVIE